MDQKVDVNVVQLVLLAGITVGVGVCAVELHKSNRLNVMHLGAIGDLREEVYDAGEKISGTIEHTMMLEDAE